MSKSVVNAKRPVEGNLFGEDSFEPLKCCVDII